MTLRLFAGIRRPVGLNPVAGTIFLKTLATIMTPSGVPVDNHLNKAVCMFAQNRVS